ncbi:MAG: Amuc_1100 family pilus-like protein [Kiritimatiellae bacterium]|nr:Amuc_1100 family pilus-like protein [Kiritimatiellia bacterium]
MKRQVVILSVCGALLLVLCAGAGFFLFKACMDKSAMKTERDENTQSIRDIYNAKVFPCKESIERYKLDAEEISKWRGTASNLFSKGVVQCDTNLSSSAFKQMLVSDVRELNGTFRTPASSSKDTPDSFGFAFDSYLGGTLPVQENVARLSRQLAMVKALMKELKEAGVAEIVSVTRDRFDDASLAPKTDVPQETGRRNKNKNKNSGRPAPTAAPAAESGGEGPFAGKERFEVSFTARPNVLVAVLNRLAAMDLYTVVAEAEIQKPNDMLRAYNNRIKTEQQRKDKDAEADGNALDQKKPTRLLVTDPELDPPAVVKLVLDVYTF